MDIQSNRKEAEECPETEKKGTSYSRWCSWVASETTPPDFSCFAADAGQEFLTGIIPGRTGPKQAHIYEFETIPSLAFL